MSIALYRKQLIALICLLVLLLVLALGFVLVTHGYGAHYIVPIHQNSNAIPDIQVRAGP